MIAFMNKFIVFPSTEYMENIAHGFLELTGTPGIIGIIDGVHIRIEDPTKWEEFTPQILQQFHNRKGFDR